MTGITGAPAVRRSAVLFLALAGLMAATRIPQLGALLSLPDASWAVFLLGGFYLQRSSYFGLLFLEATLIDWVSVAWGGVPGWCITPAYLFLLPAYASLWGGGLCAAVLLRGSPRMPSPPTVSLLLLVIPLSVALAFGVSNLGFYLFSGRFSELGVLEYAMRVSGYLPGYLQTTAGWTAAAAALHGAVLLYRLYRLHHHRAARTPGGTDRV